MYYLRILRCVLIKYIFFHNNFNNRQMVVYYVSEHSNSLKTQRFVSNELESSLTNPYPTYPHNPILPILTTLSFLSSRPYPSYPHDPILPILTTLRPYNPNKYIIYTNMFYIKYLVKNPIHSGLSNFGKVQGT